jgi:hypothetical protein
MLSDTERNVFNTALEKYRPGQCEPILVGGENVLKPADHQVHSFSATAMRLNCARPIVRQLNKIEHAHPFTRAVSVGNPREFIEAEKQEQEIR